MKKIFLFLSFITISIFTFYSCNTSGSGEAYTIKLRLNNGDTFSHKMQMQMLMDMAIMQTNMTMEADMSFKVLNADSLQKELTMTYNKLHMSMDMNKFSKVNMDSALNKSNEKIIGKTITLKLSKDNQITEVMNFENIMPDSTDEAARQTFQKMFSKEQLNSLFGMMFSMYPKNPVKVGDKWKGETKVNMAGIDMGINLTYTLLSVKNGLANIGIDGIIGGKGEMNQKGMKLKMDLSGDQKGTYTVKMNNGYLDEAAYKMNMKADMEMMGQKIPITLKADFTMKGR